MIYKQFARFRTTKAIDFDVFRLTLDDKNGLVDRSLSNSARVSMILGICETA